jgi:hypothetical protein
MISATTTPLDNNSAPDSPGGSLMPPTLFWACLVVGAVLEFLLPHRFPLLPMPLRMLMGLGSGYDEG